MERRSARGEGAQSIVEFAFMMPILFILVFGIIDFGNGLKTYITVSSAAREAARYASIGNGAVTGSPAAYVVCNGGSTNTVVQKACGTMGELQQSQASAKVECNTSCVSGNSVTVSTKYNYTYITPVKGLIRLFSGGNLSDLNISSSTTMRIE